MPTNRRRFLTRTVASFYAVGAAGGLAQSAREEISCLDYGLSFICNSASFNSVRFWIESRTTLIDDKTGQRVEFYQAASCKSENTFGEKDLFYKDNYDFLPIFGGDDVLIFRRPARLSDRYRQLKKATEVWGQPTFRLQPGRQVNLLETWEQIRDATVAGLPLVSQTEIANDQTGLRAVIECPVKTMNISHDRKLYQVDTGPVGYPDLSKRCDPAIDCLSLAFVAFNAPGFADFVVEQPTPVVEQGKELCQIYHYSNPFSLPARNRLLALGTSQS